VTLFVLVPVKGLAAGKSRLAGELDDAEREALNRKLADRVIGAALAARDVAGVIVVSGEDAVLRHALEMDAVALREADGAGLNGALEEARTLAIRLGAGAVLALPADLPFVTPADIAALAARARRGPAVAIAPETGGDGTNALLLRPAAAIPFRFGPASLRAHMAEARKARLPACILRRAGLGFDLDTPDELARLREATS
jgi:2-phospho-L-lactate guanylyltransferase